MSRKFESLTVSCDLESKEKIEQLALDFNLKWGDKPNISKLISLIASGDIVLSYPNTPNPEGYTQKQIEGIKKAIIYFTNIGDFPTAKALIDLIEI